MKKNLLIPLLCSILLPIVSCSTIEYKIKGTATSELHKNKSIYLFYEDSSNVPNPFRYVAEARLENDMFDLDFSLTDTALTNNLPMLGYLVISAEGSAATFPSVDSGTPVAICIIEEGVTEVKFEETSVSLTGTPLNQELNAIYTIVKEIAKLKDTTDEFKALNQKLKDMTYQLVKSNMSNKVGQQLFPKAYSDNLFTPYQTRELINGASETFKARPDIKTMLETLDQMD